MCGISGFYQTEFDFTKDNIWKTKVENMKNSLKHRGPDDNNIFLSKHAALGHTRLSIRDTKGAVQPMTRNFKGHYATICYNGEIYNTSEINSNLRNYDLEFSSSGDTEMILNGYLVYGTDFFRYLNGIFAFAIYDYTYDTLIIARDHLGVKPLFYTFDKNTFVFSSEQKGIFAYGIKPTADMDSFREVFALGPARTPGHGVFSGIRELLPGHYIILNMDNIYTQNKLELNFQKPYWSLTATQHTDSYDKTVEKIKYLITDSIKRQMVSDVPICTFLSGGLDSSLVSAVVARELKQKNIALHTFSFDFEKNNINFKPNDFQSSLDQPFVDIMSNYINSRHTRLECNNIIQFDYLKNAVDARDLPCMADVESSLLYFCSLVAPQCKVALTGECADEIFGGYPWFHKKELLAIDHFPWGYNMNARQVLLRDDLIKELNISEYSKNAYEYSLSQTPHLADESGDTLKRRQIAWLNIRWFMATLLNRMDRTSMYSGLEARVPFADYRILEYVYNVPWEFKYKNGITKNLLIEVGKDYLPNEVLYRKKSPYPKTYDPGYEALLKGKILDILSDANAPINNLIDKKKTLKFITQEYDYGKPWYGQLMSGPQMLAYIIQINYWMKKYSLSI